jgi:hypothetical protein
MELFRCDQEFAVCSLRQALSEHLTSDSEAFKRKAKTGGGATGLKDNTNLK